MSAHASGRFEVQLSPQALGDANANANANANAGATLGRMLIDKSFSGDLVGTGKGEMLMATTAIKGSAGYVAIERVTGALGGRSGSFVLQHTGTMNRGAPQLSVSVVPDSGTDELTGLVGTLAIIVADGEHRYEFAYALPAQNGATASNATKADARSILVQGSVVARQGCVAEALALSQEHVARSRAEPGCIAHAVHQDTENPQRLVFVEQWASQAALWEHFKLPASRAFAKALAALADEAPEMRLFDATRIDVPGRASTAG